jgi:hypothetical protein
LFHTLVQDEERLFCDLHGGQAHAAVKDKLKRTDITTAYRRVLAEVEKRLRPSRVPFSLAKLRSVLERNGPDQHHFLRRVR